MESVIEPERIEELRAALERMRSGGVTVLPWNPRRDPLEEALEQAERARRRGRGRSRSASKRRAKRERAMWFGIPLTDEIHRAWWLNQEAWSLAKL